MSESESSVGLETLALLLLAFAFALLDPSLLEATVFLSLMSARIIYIGVSLTRTDNLVRSRVPSCA